MGQTVSWYVSVCGWVRHLVGMCQLVGGSENRTVRQFVSRQTADGSVSWWVCQFVSWFVGRSVGES